jgi:phosphatidylglycerol---prolipoprotein diacylglyceryl transferase
VRPIPTSFHLGPLVFHTYGLGLAVAAYVCFIYAERRLARQGLTTAPFARFSTAVILSGLLGARLANIATNWSYYQGHPGRMLALWQGGLASFGGLALAIPVGLVLARRYWPTPQLLAFCDALVPALLAGWALGRLLGPQLMVAGGGHLTHQWFGMYYQGQVGRRVPVPLIQALEDGLTWLSLLGLAKRGVRPGVVTATGMTIWGLVRALDERLLLGQHSHSGSLGVQIAGLVLTGAGLVLGARLLRTTSSTR